MPMWLLTCVPADREEKSTDGMYWWQVASILGIKRIILDNGISEVMLPRNVSEPPFYIPPNRLPQTDPKLVRN